MTVRRLGTAGSLVMLLSVTAFVGVARAATVNCGQLITQSTTLTADVGPCPGDGIVIGADGITLDLGGHTVSGASSPGSGIAIRPAGPTAIGHARVRNGTVTGFATGVSIQFSTGNTFERLVIRDNSCVGVGLQAGADSNVVRANVISGSGCIGVSMGGGQSNLVQGNEITASRRDGIAVDKGGLNTRTGPNTISGNLIKGNGSSGVTIGFLTVDQSIVGNKIADNGQDGVHLNDFVSNTLVQGNLVVDNRGSGVYIDPHFPLDTALPGNNRILANTASGNAVFDLGDGNPGCDANIWSANTFGTRNQPCVD